MKNLRTCLASAVAVAFCGMAAAATVDLTGLGYVTYGDGQSYSLPIANYQYGFTTNTGPFAVDSQPGQIQNLTVLGTGSEGTGVTTNTSGMDDAYSTPSGISGSTFFSPNLATYRGTNGTVAFNSDNAWDTSLASLKTFLQTEQMVFFFNNNQINAGDGSLQSLAAWARIWITDASGANVGSAYEFTNNNGAYNIVSLGGGGTFLGGLGYNAGTGAGNPDGGTGTNTDFVLAGGQICVATGGALTVPVPVPCGSNPALVGGTTISSPINHNLGADHAAYAVLFPELNAALAALFASNPADLASYTMHVDIRLGCKAETAPADIWIDCATYNGYGTGLNNGYEQIFIGSALVGVCPPNNPQCNPTVPEPGSLALVATALASIGLIARRRQSKKGTRLES